MSKQVLEDSKTELSLKKSVEVDAYEIAEKLIGSNQSELALKWFNAVTESHSNYLNALRYKTYLLLSMKRYSEASLVCDVLIKKAPKDAEAYLYKGMICIHLGTKQEVLDHFNKAIELDSGGQHGAEALYRKGIFFEKERQFGEALRCYQDAFAIKKNDERIDSAIKKLQLYLNRLLQEAVGNRHIQEIKELVTLGAQSDDNILEILKRMLKTLSSRHEQYMHYLSAPGYYREPQEDSYIPFQEKELNYDYGTIKDILRALNLSDKYTISLKGELERINLAPVLLEMPSKVDSTGTLLSNLSLTSSKKEYKETQITQAHKVLRQKLADVVDLEKLNFKFSGKDLVNLEFPKDSKLTPEEIYEIAVVLNKVGLTFAEPGDKSSAIECLRTNPSKSYIAYDERPAEPLKFLLSMTKSLLLEKLGITEKNKENLFSFS